jgi:hypothetical protein
MLIQIEEDYTGPFYLEIGINQLASCKEIAHILDELSSGIILNFERPSVTIYEFLDQGSAFKGVLILQQKSIPFTLTGKNDIVFIKEI